MRKILFETDNICTNVTANSSDPNFPVSNLLTTRIGEIWKGTSYQGTLTATVSANSNCVFIGGTNAETVQITIKNTSETEILWGPTIFDLKLGTKYLAGNMWCDYTLQTSAVHIIAVLTADASQTIEAGIARSGIPEEYGNATYGFRKEFIDRSIKKTLNDGSSYYNKKDSLRRFSGELILTDADNANLINSLNLNGENPAACLVLDLDNNKGALEEWAMWANIELPSLGYEHKTYGAVRFVITESKQSIRRQV